MSDASKKQRRDAGPPKRGDAAWREHRDEIASRNERASRAARARRRDEYERFAAGRRADELLERAERLNRAR
jgi:hypothetical protein